MTESGKTSLARLLAARLKKRGYGVIVLDPINDPNWQADAVFTDFDAFMNAAYQSRSCFLFIDEAGMNCSTWDLHAYWLATQARHWGHSSIFICQRAQQLAKTMRDQCSYLYLFNCSRTDAKLLSDEFNKPELINANTLPRGTCFYVPRFGNVSKLEVFKTKPVDIQQKPAKIEPDSSRSAPQIADNPK